MCEYTVSTLKLKTCGCFRPHKCPDPKTKNAIPSNFAMRLMRGSHSGKHNNRLVHSRFCPVKTFRLGEDDAFFTCCEFIVSQPDSLDSSGCDFFKLGYSGILLSLNVCDFVFNLLEVGKKLKFSKLHSDCLYSRFVFINTSGIILIVKLNTMNIDFLC